MFNKLADGILGLFLFFSHWLSPGGDNDMITIASIRQSADAYVISCAISIDWNEHIKDLIDAGIPLRFNFRAFTTNNDTISCIRTLQCNVAAYTYQFTDSLRRRAGDSVIHSKQFDHMLLALEKYPRWDLCVPLSVKACRVEAELLPSRAQRLNQTIDMSQLCGCRLFAANVVLKRTQ